MTNFSASLNAAGNELLGEYGQIFEQEYVAILNSKLSLFDSEYQRYLKRINAHDTHRGYFSIDKKTGRAIDSTGGGRGRGKRGQGEDISDDVSAYDLILKKKEVLLSFERQAADSTKSAGLPCPVRPLLRASSESQGR